MCSSRKPVFFILYLRRLLTHCSYTEGPSLEVGKPILSVTGPTSCSLVIGGCSSMTNFVVPFTRTWHFSCATYCFDVCDLVTWEYQSGGKLKFQLQDWNTHWGNKNKFHKTYMHKYLLWSLSKQLKLLGLFDGGSVHILLAVPTFFLLFIKTWKDQKQQESQEFWGFEIE